MLPELEIGPAGGVELGLAALLLLTAGLAARRHVARRDAGDLPALFTVYLSGMLAMVLAVHALAGRRPLVVSGYSAVLAVGVLVGWYGAYHRLRGLGLAMPL